MTFSADAASSPSYSIFVIACFMYVSFGELHLLILFIVDIVTITP